MSFFPFQTKRKDNEMNSKATFLMIVILSYAACVNADALSDALGGLGGGGLSTDVATKIVTCAAGNYYFIATL